MRKRILALALSFCMALCLMPTTAFAADHVHDASCGYAEASDCTHTHDANCGGQVDENTCNHTHDTACGYSEGSPCTYVAPSTYTVTYTDGVAGEEIFAAVVYSVAEGETVPTYVPTREGDVFDGWNPNYTATVTQNTTFTAKWKEIDTSGYTVTYTDGVADEVVFDDLVYTDVESGTATPAFEETPTRAGFTFAGWSPAVAAAVTADATYTAQWTENTPAPAACTVTFYPNANDTDGSMRQQTFTAGVAQALTRNAFTREGCIFRGWNTAQDGSGTAYADGASITISENITLYAQWEEKLTITATPATLPGNGIVTLTTNKNVNITCSDSRYQGYIYGSGTNWTFQMKNNVTTNLTFFASNGAATASCTVSFEQDPDALTLTPSRTSLIGHGAITLTGNKEITSITCSNSSYNTDIYGSGTDWAFQMTRNTDVNLRFEAAAANGETAMCWISFSQYSLPSSSDDDDDDDDYTPPIPTDTEQNEDGNTVTTAEPTSVLRNDTATATITVTDGNRLVNEVVRNGSDQLVIAPKTGEDVSGAAISIPSSVTKRIVERTDADVVFQTDFANVTIDHGTVEENAGALVMEAQRTGDGISTKVTIGSAAVIDTGVQLPAGATLPDDAQLVAGEHYPSLVPIEGLVAVDANTEYVDIDDVNIAFLESGVYTHADGTEYRIYEIIQINGEQYYISNYRGTGDILSLIRLSDGAGCNYNMTSNVFDFTNSLNSSITVYENKKININGVTYDVKLSRERGGLFCCTLYYDGVPAGEMDYNDKSCYFHDGFDPETLKAQQAKGDLGTVTIGETPVDGLQPGKNYDVSVVGSNDISLEGATDVNGTVTQTFVIPKTLVGNENVVYVAVHDTNNGNEIGTITLSEDCKTLTATYTVNNFSPFIVYAFVEADEPEVKTITTNTEPKGGEDDVPGGSATGDDTPALPVDDKKTLVYIVKQGDTLWAISRKYGCTVAGIVALNGELIKDPDLILVGWELLIPQD